LPIDARFLSLTILPYVAQFLRINYPQNMLIHFNSTHTSTVNDLVRSITTRNSFSLCSDNPSFFEQYYVEHAAAFIWNNTILFAIYLAIPGTLALIL